jgi:hypothetical protein
LKKKSKIYILYIYIQISIFSHLSPYKLTELTYEIIYRAADVKGNGAVLASDFKMFLLQNLKLKISPAQISRLVFILDNYCTGVIRRAEYLSVITSYGVNSETTELVD